MRRAQGARALEAAKGTGIASAASQRAGRLPARLKLYWGSGALGVAVLMNAVSLLILVYLVSVLKLDPLLAGGLVFLSKVVDAISDPIMGVLSDRSNFRSGRRRPYMFAGAFVSALAFGLLFSVPRFESEDWTAVWVFACLVLYTLGYTLFNVPYMAMSGEMTDGYEERTSLHGYRVAFVSIGSSIAGAGAPFALQLLGQTWEAYAMVGAACSALIFASLIVCCFGTASARTLKRAETRRGFVEQLALLAANRHLLTLILAKALQLVGVMSSVTVMLFFLSQYVGMDLRYLAPFALINTAATIVAVPMFKRAAERVGKRGAYFLSAGLTLLLYLSWALVPPAPPMDEFLPGFLLRGAVSGLCIGGNVMLAMSMLTDTIDYDARRTGMRREGIHASAYSFVEKLSSALGPFLVGWILALAGYDKSKAADELQTGDALFGILFGMAYLPAIMIGLSMIALCFYRLTKAELERTEPLPARVSGAKGAGRENPARSSRPLAQDAG